MKIPGMLILIRQQAPTGPSEGNHDGSLRSQSAQHGRSGQKCRAAGYQIQREFKGSEGFPNAYMIGPDDVKVEIARGHDTDHAGHGLSLALPEQGGRPDYVDGTGMRKTFSATVKKRGMHDAADIPGMNLTFGVSTNSAHYRHQRPIGRSHRFRSEESGSVLQEAGGQRRETGRAVQENSGRRHRHCVSDRPVRHLYRADRGSGSVLIRPRSCQPARRATAAAIFRERARTRRRISRWAAYPD